MIDGLAATQVEHLKEIVENKARMFKINSRSYYKQSGALHEMYLTGKFSNNFVADPIKEDNLLYQFNQADLPLQFSGSPYPVNYLGGRDPNSLYYNQSNTTVESFPLQSLCPLGYENLYDGVHLELNEEQLEDKKKLFEFLDIQIGDKPSLETITDCFKQKKIYAEKNNLNLIYYTASIDNHNHAYSKNSHDTFKVTYGMEKTILKLIEWVNKNPEYALILSSDHGGQEFFGEDSYCNHGCSREGNQGILFLYVNEFSKKKVDQSINTIDIFDVAPTITQIIENVNVPLNAEGFPADIGWSKFKYLI